jgi:hypothetical protein
MAILEARRADYARAEAEVDTSGDAVEQSLAKLMRVITAVLGPDAAPPSPRVRGEGWASRDDLSPRAGRGKEESPP